MLFYIMSDRHEILGVTTVSHNRYLDFGNGSNKFGNHWIKEWKASHFPLFVDVAARTWNCIGHFSVFF